MSIEVKIKMADLMSSRFDRAIDRAQYLLDSQIVQDTSPFTPFRTGTLDSSVMRATDLGSGQIVYDTPYARHMYYGVHCRTGKPFNFNKKFHPLATQEWIEASKAVYLEKWTNTVREIMGQ